MEYPIRQNLLQYATAVAMECHIDKVDFRYPTLMACFCRDVYIYPGRIAVPIVITPNTWYWAGASYYSRAHGASATLVINYLLLHILLSTSLCYNTAFVQFISPTFEEARLGTA